MTVGVEKKLVVAMSPTSEVVAKYPKKAIGRQTSKIVKNLRGALIFSPLENLNFKLLGVIIVRNLTMGNILVKPGFEM